MCEIQSIEIESPILPGVEKIGGYGGNSGGEKNFNIKNSVLEQKSENLRWQNKVEEAKQNEILRDTSWKNKMDQKFDALENDVSFRLTKTLGFSRWSSWDVPMCWLCVSVKTSMFFFPWNHAAWKKIQWPLLKRIVYSSTLKNTKQPDLVVSGITLK